MPETKPPVLVFLVDAFRHDFLSERTSRRTLPNWQKQACSVR